MISVPINGKGNSILAANAQLNQWNNNISVNNTTPVQTIVVAGPFTVDITATGTLCRGGTGSIIAKASGGTPPYTYSLDGGTARRNGWFIRLSPGNRTLTITDAAGNTASTTVIIPNTFDPPEAIAGSLTDATGCTNSDAGAILGARGGTPPYTYSWDRVNFQSSPVFNTLHPGFYTFSVKDANGCIGSGINSVTWLHIANGCEPTGSGGSYTAYTCHSTGNISWSAAGSYPPFTYSLDQTNWQATGEFNNLPAGLHKVYSKDSRGNISMSGIHIAQYCYPILQLNTHEADCKQHNGTVTVTKVTNANPPYQYSIDGVNWGTSNTFVNLTPGNYIVGVKDRDGELGYDEFTVIENCPEIVSLDFTYDRCGSSNGSITVNATKGVPPYKYSIDGTNFQTADLFSNLSAGIYTVTVKDANDNIVSDQVEVKASCINIALQLFASACGKDNGTLDIQSYSADLLEFSLNNINWQTTPQFTYLKPGNYILYVKSASGDKKNFPFLMIEISGPALLLNLTPPNCNTLTASLQLSATGGAPPYEFSLDNTNWQVSGLFPNLAANQVFNAYVRDKNLCVTQQGFATTIKCLALTLTATADKCNTRSGTIKADATDGTPPYQYSINGINYQSSPDFTGLASNTYTIYAKDQDGNIKQANIQVPATCPTPLFSVIHESCSKGNGSISFTGSGGTAPYLFSLSATNFLAVSSFGNLTAGNYNLYIRDADGNINSVPFRINNTPGPQVQSNSSPASCNNNDGSITLRATGNAPFTYRLINGAAQNSPLFERLATGDYNTIVEDRNGCQTQHTPTVALNNNLTLDAGPDLRICEGSSIQIAASSNAQRYNWTGTAISNNADLQPKVNPVITTRYLVTATKGPCQLQDEVVVNVDAAPIADAGPGTVICYGKDAQLHGSGGIQYRWTPSSGLSDARSGSPTVNRPTQTVTYRLQVTDNNNCNSLNESSVTITVTPPPKIDAGPDLVLARNQPHPLKATDLNNSGISSYSWQPAEGLSNPYIANPVANLQRSITYTIRGLTPAGCEGLGKLSIKVNDGPEIYVPNAFTPNHDGKNDILKAIPVGIKTFKYFTIFNRYGQRIFHTTDPNTGWDGGSIQAGTNTYVWMAEGIDYNGKTVQRKGNVILIR